MDFFTLTSKHMDDKPLKEKLQSALAWLQPNQVAGTNLAAYNKALPVKIRLRLEIAEDILQEVIDGL